MAAALDQHYDGLIVGAGHHGLVLGSYLQKCGPRYCWWIGGCSTAARW